MRQIAGTTVAIACKEEQVKPKRHGSLAYSAWLRSAKSLTAGRGRLVDNQ